MSVNKKNPSISISKQALGELPAEHFHGNIHLIDKPEAVEEAVEYLKSCEILGFDTETRPAFKRGQSYNVSLLQISSKTDCYLFRLNKIGMPESLKELLENPEIKKIGVSLHDDFHNLHKQHTLNQNGFIDLQPFVKEYGIIDNSLSRIYGILFGKRISKGQRLTNWEADRLTDAQQEYASLDALSCIHIYEYLLSGHFDPFASPYIIEDDED